MTISIHPPIRLSVLCMLCMLLSFAAAAPAAAASYYIDAIAGSDSNDGLSKATAWKNHPYMRGWQGSYSHTAGDRFVFKGGVTWTASSFPMIVVGSGTNDTPDYYGVDDTWFAGSSWRKPGFDGQYALTSGGDGTGSLLQLANVDNVTIDDLEIAHLLAPVAWSPALVEMQNVSGIVIRNCDIHGWQLPAGLSKDDAHGGVVVNSGHGGVAIDHCNISNAEFSSTRNNGVCVHGVQEVRYSTLHDAPTAILFASNVHDNVIYNINFPRADFDPTYHTNVVYQGGAALTAYNNLMYDLNAGVNLYLEPCWGGVNGSATAYDNVIESRATTSVQLVAIDMEGGVGASCGTVTLFNNTLAATNGVLAVRVVNRAGGPSLTALTLRSNYYISDGRATCYNSPDSSCANAGALVNEANVISSVAAANAQGYRESNHFAPVDAFGITVAKGVGGSAASGQFDIRGVTRPQPGGRWDAGAYQFVDTRDAPLPPRHLTAIVQ